MKTAVPWWMKIAAKLVLSRVPMGYRFLSSIGIFRHGRMNDAAYASGVFARHYQRVGLASRQSPFVALELGVGDSVSSAILAKAHGASSCYLVDAGRFADDDLSVYEALIDELRREGADIPGLDGVETLDDLVSRYGGVYLVEGLESLRSLPGEIVDFAWSQAVLEHVRLHEFDATFAELHRILAPDGIMSHRVDLKDHLSGALNNRRFSTAVWEADWMARSGFYTNRISFPEMVSRFERAGFAVEVVNVDRWDELPTPRSKMAPECASIPDDDLLVSGFDVLLRKA